MPDENETIPTNTETQETGNAGQPVDVTTTPEFQAAVAAAAQKAHDAAFAKFRREADARKGEAPKSKAAETLQSPPAQTGDRAFEDSLADALAEQKLTKDQRQLVRKLARMEKPEDVDTYVSHMAATFGPAPAAAAGNPTINNAAKPAPIPAPAAPAPNSKVPGDGPERMLSMTESQISDFIAKNGGGDPGNTMHWSNRAASILLARRLEAEMAGIRLVGTKGR